MSQILITDNQLERLTRFMIKEQAEKNPLLKLFYRHLSDSAKLYWDGTNFSCRKKKIKCLTEKDKVEMLESFARWINKNPYVKEKPNKRISVITISGKQEKEEIPNIIPTDPEEVCVPVFLSTIEIISDGQTQPFENNSTKLRPSLIEALNDVALIASDFKDEGKPVNIVDFTIHTSSSRYRNTKKYLGKSFSKLSQDRALAVQQYVQDKFGPLGIKVPQATIDATGGNNDGSSGPNPPKPNNVVYDEGETQKSYTGGDIEEHRGDFNTPHNSSQEYEQYKYAVVTIGLETTFPEEDGMPEEGIGGLMQSSTPVEITNWKVRFYPKSKKKRNPPRFKTPKSEKIKINWSNKCEKKLTKGKTGYMMINEYKKMGKILITEKQLKKLSDILLREQHITKEKLPVIDFTNTLKDNMVGVDDAALETKLVELENLIKKAEKEGKKLESIGIDITAGASQVPATNRLPQGKSRPDHTYMKIVPVDKWTTYNQKKELGTLKKQGDLPEDYNPNTGYYEIEEGNKFLSRNRAHQLSKKLKKYFADHYPEITPQFKIKLQLNQDKKFATAKITGVTYKKEIPPPTIPYIQFVNAPKGYEKSRYHMWDKEGAYTQIIPTTYEEIKNTMYKTPEEGGYTKDDQFFRVREKVDMTWEDFIKNRRRIKAGKGTSPEFNKLKPIPERQKEKKV